MNIKKVQKRNGVNRKLRLFCVSLLSLILLRYPILADNQVQNPTIVNQTPLPNEGSLRVVSIQPIQGTSKDGLIVTQCTSYAEAMKALGLNLLTSSLVTDDQYTTVEIDTDNKNIATLSLDNYIIGDGSHFRFIKEWGNFGRYQAETPGEVYGRGIDLTVRMALSEEQCKTGMGIEFMGNYQYLGSYKSKQGFLVNLIGTIQTEPDVDSEGLDVYSVPDKPDSYNQASVSSFDTVSAAESIESGSANTETRMQSSQIIAIFVEDGIQYQVSGIVTEDTMKDIVDSFSGS